MSRERKRNIFTQVPSPKVRRNLFDLSHEVKMSGKFGYLYPVLCVETLPGDTFRDQMNVLCRFAPMAAPVMHRMDVTTHFFFVPNRIIWDNWESFITGGQDGTEAPIPPYYTPAGLFASTSGDEVMQKGTLWDYLGLPTTPTVAPGTFIDEHVSSLPFYAVCKVWNDYYRDPNLQDEMPIPTELDGDVSANQEAVELMFGLNNATQLSYLRRGFEKDYFTSALPWAQRGAQVLMPLAGVAGTGDIEYKDSPWGAELFKVGGTTYASSGAPTIAAGGNPAGFTDDEASRLRIENIDSITFDNASTTINDFRRALAIQRWLEANARGGARYVEQIEGHFAVRVPDYRLQRAEYLGGGRQPVQISEVLSTANTEQASLGDAYIGEMAGHGISVGSTNRFTYRCQEHGYIIGFMSVTMRTAYSQGIPKMFSRSDKFDYAWPELANLGEQEIKSKEVFFSFNETDQAANDAVFGYIPRYAEYKFHNDRIAGDFRGSLSFWHEGRRFTSRPALDAAFTTIYENGDGAAVGSASSSEESFRRIFWVNDGTDYLWFQLYHKLTAKRPLPYFGVPAIM